MGISTKFIEQRKSRWSGGHCRRETEGAERVTEREREREWRQNDVEGRGEREKAVEEAGKKICGSVWGDAPLRRFDLNPTPVSSHPETKICFFFPSLSLINEEKGHMRICSSSMVLFIYQSIFKPKYSFRPWDYQNHNLLVCFPTKGNLPFFFLFTFLFFFFSFIYVLYFPSCIVTERDRCNIY